MGGTQEDMHLHFPTFPELLYISDQVLCFFRLPLCIKMYEIYFGLKTISEREKAHVTSLC